MKCYRCGLREPVEFRTICRQCILETRASATAAPQNPRCAECGLEYVDDNERVQHEVVERHHYRSARRAS